MSGIETVRVIVQAEKQAAMILEDAQAKASEIRKRLESLIEEQRNEILRSARKEAALIVERAENEGKLEAEHYEKEADEKIRQLVTRTSAKKSAAVEKLVNMVLGQEHNVRNF